MFYSNMIIIVWNQGDKRKKIYGSPCSFTSDASVDSQVFNIELNEKLQCFRTAQYLLYFFHDVSIAGVYDFKIYPSPLHTKISN